MGRINGNVSQRADSYSFYIDWSESLPADYLNTNTSTVSATAYIYCSKHSAYASGLPQTLVIDGTTFTDTKYVSLSSGVTVALVSGTKTIEHNSDGTKSITISAECDLPDGNGWGPAWGSASGTATLETIPRKSILYASSATLNSTQVGFTIDRKSSNFTDSIYYINPATSAEVLIVNKTSQTTYNWTPPTTLYQYFPNSNNIYMEFKSYTYNGDALVGTDTAHCYIYANESDCKPTATVTATPTDYSSLTGSATTIIKNVSNVAVSVTGTPKNSATIKKIVTNNVTLSENTTTGSNTFQKVDTGTFTTIVTDSRGYNTTDTKSFTTINYILLTISANAYRTNATSSTIKAVIQGDYFDGSFGSQSNTLTLTWKCKLKSSSTYTTGGTLTATKADGKYTTGEITLTAPSGVDFSYENDLDFLFIASDKINTTGIEAVYSVKKGIPIFDYGLDSNGNNYLNINGNLYKNNENALQRHIMTLIKTTNQNVTPEQSPIIIEMDNVKSSTGSKLTFSNYSVKIGSGVSKVLASGLCWAEQSNGYKWITIRKKSNSTYTTEASAITPRNVNEDWDSVAIAPTLIDVSENDEISMWIATTGSTTGRVSGQTYPKSTYLTVEVVE